MICGFRGMLFQIVMKRGGAGHVAIVGFRGMLFQIVMKLKYYQNYGKNSFRGMLFQIVMKRFSASLIQGLGFQRYVILDSNETVRNLGNVTYKF